MDFGRGYKTTGNSFDFNSATAQMEPVQKRPRAKRVHGPDEYQKEQERAVQSLMTMTYEDNLKEYLEEEAEKKEEMRKREMIHQSNIVRQNMLQGRALTARDIVLEKITRENNGVLPDYFVKKSQGRKTAPIKPRAPPKPKTVNRPARPKVASTQVQELVYYVVEEVVVQPKPKKTTKDDDCIVIEQFGGKDVRVQPKPKKTAEDDDCIVIEQFGGKDVRAQPKPKKRARRETKQQDRIDDGYIIQQFGEEVQMLYDNTGTACEAIFS